MPGAVYSPFADRLRDHAGPVFPLHVGDTWLEPVVGARAEDQHVAEHDGLHRYCDTRGLPALVDALVDKVRARNGIACERDHVLVTAGATSGLGCALGAIVEPGDEVLVLAPFWPLIRGIVQSLGGVPVEVPFFDRVDGPAAAVRAVAERAGPRTVALYVSTPSNPTGRVIDGEMLAALAGWARRADVWLVADEVYEDFVYEGEHVSLAPMAPERSITAFSFSKAYGMAGNRVGYLVGPAAWIHEAHKLGTHSFYNAPTAGQVAALRALELGAKWQAEARAAYRDVGTRSAEVLGVPAPAGSTFLFLDVRDRLDERGVPGILERCFERGVLVAPGASSGRDYADWVRLCFTVLPPEETLEAVDRIREVVGRTGR
jgi:N-succinyldiaminopimelate aminotransferase